MRIEIPLKLASLNEYIDICRRNYYMANRLKKSTQEDIKWFLKDIPRFENPIKIHFTWIEINKKRDLDNISFSKKFILDAMVELGIIKNDNLNHVTRFTDGFEIGDDYKVILDIEEGILEDVR